MQEGNFLAVRRLTPRRQKVGGQGGIRTPGTVARTPHFECGAFNRSATFPCRSIPACAGTPAFLISLRSITKARRLSVRLIGNKTKSPVQPDQPEMTMLSSNAATE